MSDLRKCFSRCFSYLTLRFSLSGLRVDLCGSSDGRGRLRQFPNFPRQLKSFRRSTSPVTTSLSMILQQWCHELRQERRVRRLPGLAVSACGGCIIGRLAKWVARPRQPARRQSHRNINLLAAEAELSALKRGSRVVVFDGTSRRVRVASLHVAHFW